MSGRFPAAAALLVPLAGLLAMPAAAEPARREGWSVEFIPGDKEPWTLVELSTDKVVCQLPCRYEVAADTPLGLRTPSEFHPLPLGLDAGDHPYDQPLVIQPHRSTGSFAATFTVGLVATGALSVGFVLGLLGESHCSGATDASGNCLGTTSFTAYPPGVQATGLVLLGVGVAATVVTVVLAAQMHDARVDVVTRARAARRSGPRITSVGPGWLTGEF